MKTEVLEKIQFGLQAYMSDSLRAQIELHEEPDLCLRAFVRTLTFYLAGNQVHTEEHDDAVTYPATIWEELKRYWPSWLRERFPIRYTREVTHRTVKHYHMCPHLDVPANNSKHINFLTCDDLHAEPGEEHL